MPQISVKLSENLKKRLEDYADSNEISQRGVIRMLLNQELPELPELEGAVKES